MRWRDALCGGVLVAFLWQIGQHFLALFVISNRYSVYGVVGSFIALMVWFYYASAAVFLARGGGAEPWPRVVRRGNLSGTLRVPPTKAGCVKRTTRCGLFHAPYKNSQPLRVPDTLELARGCCWRPPYGSRRPPNGAGSGAANLVSDRPSCPRLPSEQNLRGSFEQQTERQKPMPLVEIGRYQLHPRAFSTPTATASAIFRA